MEEMGHMRTRTGWLALLLTAGVALAPTGVRGQEVPPADPVVPLPLYHDRPERGGFYAAAEFMFFRQDNPLKGQVIAVRGLLDFDGSITRDLNGTLVNPTNGGTPVIAPITVLPGGIINFPTVTSGTPQVANFIGSGTPALHADDAGGPLSYQPGVRLTLGWRFEGGVTAEVSWWMLSEAKYQAVATLVPPGLNAGPLLADTFLFSPVYNFPNDFVGPPFKLALGNPNAAYGIWDGASVMQIAFVQRFTQYDITSRIPIFETDYCRCYGLVGMRHVSEWERFTWRTVAEDFNGQADQTDVAIYSNVVSNQMYGPFIGCGNEVYCGHGFAFSLDLKTAGMIDFVHEIAKYERGDIAIASKRAKRQWEFVPEFEASGNIWWYPIEGVQIKVGYDVMEFLNTIGSPDPVNFNYGGLDVNWTHVARFMDGFHAGIGFIF
jgi:hypothetical protein